MALRTLDPPAGHYRNAAVEVAQPLSTPPPEGISDKDIRIGQTLTNTDTAVLNEPAEEKPEKVAQNLSTPPPSPISDNDVRIVQNLNNADADVLNKPTKE
jgi:hypothetical protein